MSFCLSSTSSSPSSSYHIGPHAYIGASRDLKDSLVMLVVFASMMMPIINSGGHPVISLMQMYFINIYNRNISV